MNTIRPSAVAGLYYPARTHELERLISQQFATNSIADQPTKTVRALIVPHSGYFYSGAVAAQAYTALTEHADDIDRVIVIGPSHHQNFKGIALSEADYFSTPFGNVPVAKPVVTNLSRLANVTSHEKPHIDEHALEVQLPFLQYALKQFEIVPMLTGQASPKLISDVLEVATEGARSLIIVSSDLSHYLDYATARRTDQFTSQAIISLDHHGIDESHACGSAAICGFLEYAQSHQLHGEIRALQNSGDIIERRDSVVGYGAYLFT